ncbi:DUF1310 family protein [Ligilactobacillus araffinosus]|uniref:Uncharacterized protein n=1 Tax=Ligilactobacillus araffinosus DSM 20653 TaxID=1423820 RepID=A0A0R1ZA81_9LACO|nr:DUF1310 family protein [Ligilactobacillus araffinosus]KRM51741.1 hypothetical protein FC64_GL000930 [Ligilactobacillus araffinosus DSM 20653]
MNKKIKIFLVILIPATILFLGGIFIENSKEEQHTEMIRIAKEHQKEMDEQVRYGDKNHHIKAITYQWNTVEHNPMGGFELQGYVNNDKNLDFGISFDSDNGGKSIYCYEYRESKKLGEFIGDY